MMTRWLALLVAGGLVACMPARVFYDVTYGSAEEVTVVLTERASLRAIPARGGPRAVLAEGVGAAELPVPPLGTGIHDGWALLAERDADEVITLRFRVSPASEARIVALGPSRTLDGRALASQGFMPGWSGPPGPVLDEDRIERALEVDTEGLHWFRLRYYPIAGSFGEQLSAEWQKVQWMFDEVPAADVAFVTPTDNVTSVRRHEVISTLGAVILSVAGFGMTAIGAASLSRALQPDASTGSRILGGTIGGSGVLLGVPLMISGLIGIFSSDRVTELGVDGSPLPSP